MKSVEIIQVESWMWSRAAQCGDPGRQLIHGQLEAETCRDPHLHWSNVDDLETSQVKGTVLATDSTNTAAPRNSVDFCTLQTLAIQCQSNATMRNIFITKCLQAELIHHVQNRQHGHIGLATTSGCTHLKSSGRDHQPVIKPW